MKNVKRIAYVFVFLASQWVTGQKMTVVDYEKAWDNMSKILIDTAERMPESLYDQKPNEKIRSFGEQINHLTRSNIGLGMMVFGKRPEFSFDKNSPPNDKNDIIDLFKKSSDYFKQNLQSLNDGTLGNIIEWGRPGSGRKITKHQGLLMIYSHFQLEYGKITIYARLNNIEPAPSSGWSF